MEIVQLAQDQGLLGWLVPSIFVVVAAVFFYMLVGELKKSSQPRYHSPKPYSFGGFSRAPRKFDHFKSGNANSEIKASSEIQPSIPDNGRLNSDYVEQLRHLMGASFRRKRVMNRSEFRVFRIVEEELRSVRGGHRILSQTSLGEILDSDDKLAFASINAKRVDILVIQPNGEPLAVFEFQGKGHYQNMAAARDAVKKEALRLAGVHYLEVNDSHEPDEIRRMVRKVLQ